MAGKGEAVLRGKVVIALNTAWNLLNFRSGLIRALVESGYEVVAVAPADEFAERVAMLGCRFIPFDMDNHGTHPGRDMLLLWRLFKFLSKEKPDVFIGYTIKPNIYGSMAAGMLDIPVINNISGLGTLFIRKGFLTQLVKGLYRLVLKRSARVFFQNRDDLELFVSSGLVPTNVTDLLPGSGVDLKRFDTVELPNQSHMRFLLVARMLIDKGVYEFVEAARLLKQRGSTSEFCLLGKLDENNPAAVSRLDLEAWVNEGTVLYLGVRDDVRDEIVQADCVVLPSYREGTPKSLLEAAAMGRPIVTTDAVGCREVVDDGVNGFMCRAKDSSDLAAKMAKMEAISPTEREEMGIRGRRMIESRFDERIVIDKYLKEIQLILSQRVNYGGTTNAK